MKALLTLMIAFSYLCSHAQIISSVTITKDSLEIGEAFQIIYKLTLPQNVGIQYLDFSPYDNIESLAVQDTSLAPYYAELELQALFANEKDKRIPGNLFKSISQGTNKILTDTIKAVFWDIGVFEIPHPELIKTDTSNTLQVMEMESPRIMVTPPIGIENQDTTTAILPIKGIIKTEKSWKEYWPYLAGFLIVTILALGLLYIYGSKKKKEKSQETIAVEAPPEPAHVIALGRLNKLEKEQLWKAGKVKEYQSELTYTLREYLENRYETPALEQTTDLIVKETQRLGLNQDQQKDISEILRIADMVKFAKAKPEEDINARFLERTRNFVLETILTHTNIDADESLG